MIIIICSLFLKSSSRSSGFSIPSSSSSEKSRLFGLLDEEGWFTALFPRVGGLEPIMLIIILMIMIMRSQNTSNKKGLEINMKILNLKSKLKNSRRSPVYHKSGTAQNERCLFIPQIAILRTMPSIIYTCCR